MSQYFWGAPPIARTLAAITFTTSLLVFAARVIPYQYLYFSARSFLQLPPELWRLVTPFFLTERGLGVLFDSYFLYKYAAKLEIASPRFSQRADFFAYICFVCLVILVLNAALIGGRTFASALALGFITTSAKDDWDLPVSFFVTFPAQYLPYLFMLITFLCRGPQAALKQASGFFAAHLYDFLTGLYPVYGGPNRNLLPTPEFLKKIWGTRAEVQRPYGTAIAGASTPAKPAWGIGLGSWGQWGPGHRLGGDAEAGMVQQQGNGRKILVLAVVAFVLIACGLGVLFMMHRDPEGWWTTLWEALLGGDMSGNTTENGGLQSGKGN